MEKFYDSKQYVNSTQYVNKVQSRLEGLKPGEIAIVPGKFRDYAEVLYVFFFFLPIYICICTYILLYNMYTLDLSSKRREMALRVVWSFATMMRV